MIELQNIRKVFNEGRPNEYIALHGLSLTIAAHQVTVADRTQRLGENHYAQPHGMHGQTHGRPYCA